MDVITQDSKEKMKNHYINKKQKFQNFQEYITFLRYKKNKQSGINFDKNSQLYQEVRNPFDLEIIPKTHKSKRNISQLKRNSLPKWIWPKFVSIILSGPISDLNHISDNLDDWIWCDGFAQIA